jgi:hypothetical protein
VTPIAQPTSRHRPFAPPPRRAPTRASSTSTCTRCVARVATAWSRDPTCWRPAATRASAAARRARGHAPGRRPSPAPPPAAAGGRARVSPRARRLAEELGVDPAERRAADPGGPSPATTCARPRRPAGGRGRRGRRERRGRTRRPSTRGPPLAAERTRSAASPQPLQTERRALRRHAPRHRGRHGQVQARDPALLPDPAHRHGDGADLARGAQPRASAGRARPARRAAHARDRAGDRRRARDERLLPRRRFEPPRPCTWAWASRSARAA